MVKKLLSLILASLMIVSCFPIASQAAETDDYSSSASTITLDDVSKNNIIDIIVSINPVSNVQGILLDLDKAYSKFQYQGYEVLDSSLSKGSVVVNSSPVDYTYTDIMAALQFPDGGVSYSQKTDLIKFKFKARSSFSGFSYGFTVKEIYDKNLKDLSTSVMSIRSLNESTAAAVTLSSIKVTAPSKTTYYVGDSFSTSGMAVTAVYSDGSTKDVTSSASTSGFSSTSAGTKTITVSYTESSVTKTATFTVTVKAVELSSIAVTSKPTKTTYYVGDNFDRTGMKITATYNNGSTKDVTSGAIVSGFNSTSTGTKTLTVSYTENSVTKTATFTVTVKLMELTSITIASKPTKTTYYVGDSFDKTGLKITATYDSGDVIDVTYNATLSGFSSTSAGTKTITATYGGKTATFTVTVKAVELSSIAVTTKPTKTTYYVGDSFDKTGLKVTATYNNGSTADVTGSATLSGFSSTSAGTKTVTVSYGGKTATFTVTVKAVEVSSIAITSKPTKTTYYTGQSFDKTGLKVTATYNNGSTKDVTSSVTLSGFSSTSAGTKTVTATYSGKTATFTVTVKAALANTSTVSTTSAKTGSAVTIKGAATGGSGTYKYAYYYKRNSSTKWTLKGTEYGTATSVDLTPAYAETYTVRVNVKDSEGTVVSKDFTINVTASALVNNSTASSASTKVGSTVTITGAAKGGSGTYKYAFYYKRGSSTNWTLKGTEYGSATSVDLTPSYADTYTVRVNVKDSAGTVTSKDIKITVGASELINNSTVSSTSTKVGSTVTIKGAAKGGTGVYKYAFYYKRAGSTDGWKLKGTEYGTATSVDLTPTFADTYTVKVNVKDSAGTVTSKELKITVAASALVNNSTVSSTSTKVDSTVTIKGAAKGGTGVYKYAFYYKRAGSTDGWKLKGTEYGTATSVDLTPTFADTYTVKVNVKDSAGTVTSKELKITVAASALKNNSTVSSTSVQVGSNVTISGAAKGGTGVYKYAFYYKRAGGSSSWTVKGTEFGTAKSVTLSPAYVDTYTVKVVVKDSSGTTAEKTFTINSTNTASQVVALVNAERAKVGLPALTVNTTLNKLATMKSQDMHDKNYFDHDSPTYGSAFDVMKANGVSYKLAGENIAKGQKTPEAVMNSWMNSEGHKANILNSKFTQIGVGYVEDGNYWTQMFIG